MKPRRLHRPTISSMSVSFDAVIFKWDGFKVGRFRGAKVGRFKGGKVGRFEGNDGRARGWKLLQDSDLILVFKLQVASHKRLKVRAVSLRCLWVNS